MLLYFADGSFIECDFGPSLSTTNRSIVTKFHNIDHDRFVSNSYIGVFSYTNYETINRILESNIECYQDVDQLCQPWVQKLYEIDKQHQDFNKTGFMLHACECVRYRTKMTYNGTYSRFVDSSYLFYL